MDDEISNAENNWLQSILYYRNNTTATAICISEFLLSQYKILFLGKWVIYSQIKFMPDLILSNVGYIIGSMVIPDWTLKSGEKMIKVLILYYLNLKATHGYEIQKFIQVNHMDSWTKIQSGSIYYALAKLEKEGLIVLAAEENVGAKLRKVYSITNKGRKELAVLVREELNSRICEVGSDKFILYPLLSISNKNEIEQVIKSHVLELEKKKATLQKWYSIKVDNRTLEVEKISFEMMLSSYDYQIKWHLALISQLDSCIASSKEVARVIMTYDFSNAAIVSSDSVADYDGLINDTLNL